jgi:hypothetical protein
MGVPLDPSFVRVLLERGAPWDGWAAAMRSADRGFHDTYVKPLEENALEDLGLDLNFTTFLQLTGGGSGSDGPAAAFPEDEADLPPCVPRGSTGAEWSAVNDDGEWRVRLRPYGERIEVTPERKAEYVEELWRWRTFGTQPLAASLLQGLGTLVPWSILCEVHAVLEPEEFSAVIAGESGLDVDDWERNTIYTHGYTRNDPAVTFFWRALREWEVEEPTMLRGMLHFATGTLRVPAGGFANLQGHAGSHKFALAKGVHLRNDALPVVHACICTMDWPEYPDFETAKEKLRIAIEFGNSGFDEGGATREAAA